MSGYNISPQLDRNKYFTVNLNEIEGRLDPFFYRPIFSSYKVKSKPLKYFANAINHPPEYERIYSEKGFQLLRAQNVKPTGIEIDNNPVFFNEEFLKGKNLFIPEIGDVLVVRSGVNAGDTAIIEEYYDNVIIGADNLLVKVNEKIIPKFLQVFFFTAYGKTLMNRYLTGATNKHINPVNLGKIPVPIIDIKAQEKIIEIFETALLQKKNNELASVKLLAGIDDYLLNKLGITMLEPLANSLNNRIYTTTIKNISGNRFDPNYNHANHSNNISLIKTGNVFGGFCLMFA